MDFEQYIFCKSSWEWTQKKQRASVIYKRWRSWPDYQTVQRLGVPPLGAEFSVKQAITFREPRAASPRYPKMRASPQASFAVASLDFREKRFARTWCSAPCTGFTIPLRAHQCCPFRSLVECSECLLFTRFTGEWRKNFTRGCALFKIYHMVCQYYTGKKCVTCYNQRTRCFALLLT